MIRDLRASIDNRPTFAHIASHNKNVRKVISNLAAEATIATPAAVKKELDGIKTRLNCGYNRKVFVKTFSDGSAKVWEEC